MMTRRTAALVVGLGLTSCGDPESAEAVAFAEHCGVAGPVRVLELAPDQAMMWSRRFGEHVYYAIGRPDPATEASSSPEFTDPSLWATGLCGESPTRVADGLFHLFEFDRWPGRVFGCDQRGDIVLLDPNGAGPQVVFADVGCGVHPIDQGLLTVIRTDKTAPSRLQLHPYPDDLRGGSPDPIVLVDGVMRYGGLNFTEDAIRVVSSAGELLRIDPADLSITIEHTDVRDYSLSADGRYLLWRSFTVTGGPPDRPAGIVNLSDRTAGWTVSLGESTWPVSGNDLRWADRGLLLHDIGAQRIYFLSDLSFIDLPPGTNLDYAGPLDDDRWVLEDTTGSKSGWLHMLDLKDGAITPLVRGQGLLRDRDADGLLVLQRPSTPDGAYGRAESPMWLIPYDGNNARILSERATLPAYRPDPTRLVTPLDIGPDDLGSLVLIDSISGAEQRIDDHVQAASVIPGYWDRELVTYSVRDGERSGVWVARLPPAP